MTTTAPQSPRCPRCGHALTGDDLSSNCPRCLARLLLSDETDSALETSFRPNFRRLENYELLEEVARGGMGVVFRARQVSLNRIVAVKVLRDAWLATPLQVKRFRAEAANAAKLKHPNIVAVHEVGEQEGQHFFAMDLVQGKNLAEMTREGPVSPRRAAELVSKVAQAVQHAHEQGVLHRDIKPSNVLLDSQGEPHVTDFGLARPLDDESSLTLTGQVLGTPGYMAPEQAKGGGTVGPMADVYGLGALLYHLLTGRPPFVGTSTAETLTQVIEQEPLSPRILNPRVNRDLETICLKGLEKTPAGRYEAAGMLAEDLRRWLAGEPIQARPITQGERMMKWARRKPVVASLVAGMILLLLVIAIGSPLAIWRIHVSRSMAEAQRIRAETARDSIRRSVYVAEINVAFQSLSENNLGRARELLDRQRPKPGEEDLRGFEWRRLWQLCRGDEYATFPDGPAEAVAFSPDDNLFASAGQAIAVRELKSGRVVTHLGTPGGSLSFAPNVNLLASANERSVCLWDTMNWQRVKSLPEARHLVLFSPDGHFLLTGTETGFRLWDTATWKPLGDCGGVPQLPNVWSHNVAFSPDGLYLVTIAADSFLGGDHYRVWRLPGLERLPDLRPEPAEPRSVAFTQDGKHIICGLWDGQVLVWDFATRKVVSLQKGHTGWVNVVAVARGGRTFATTSADRTIALWDAVTFAFLARRRGHVGEARSLAITSDATTLASTSTDGTTKLWSTEAKEAEAVLEGPTLVAGFTEPGPTLVGIMTNGLCLWRPGEVGSHLSFNIPPRVPFLLANIWGVPYAVRSDEPSCAVGREDGRLEVWHLTNRVQLASWVAHKGSVKAVAFSKDGRRLATAGAETRIWDFANRRELMQLGPTNWSANCLAFSPDGTLLAGSSLDQPLQLWHLKTGLEVRLENGPSSDTFSVAFSPDGKLLAGTTLDSNEVLLWEVPIGHLVATLRGHVMGVHSVAFSPDGRTMATGSSDRRVKLWNVAARQELATLPTGATMPMVSFSPDGRWLTIGDLSSAGKRIWALRAPTFEEIAAADKAELR